MDGEGVFLVADVEQDEDGFGGVADGVGVSTGIRIQMDRFSLSLPDDGMIAP